MAFPLLRNARVRVIPDINVVVLNPSNRDAGKRT
jgi:hypothetical protein